MQIDRKALFDGVRKPLFNGKFSQKQVQGINAIVDAFLSANVTNLDWIAYGLATAFHETARTMQPIAEYGKGKGKPYGKPGKHGQSQHGRGYVQLTWDSNYERADLKLGLQGALLRNFDLAMRPDIAADIMVRGMVEGWFTGKELGDYLNAGEKDFVNARRIINGTDKASVIAGYARAFRAALKPVEAEKPSKATAPEATAGGIDKLIKTITETKQPEGAPMKGMNLNALQTYLSAALAAVPTLLVSVGCTQPMDGLLECTNATLPFLTPAVTVWITGAIALAKFVIIQAMQPGGLVRNLFSPKVPVSATGDVGTVTQSEVNK